MLRFAKDEESLGEEWAKVGRKYLHVKGAGCGASMVGKIYFFA